jgi:hypothetical protein
MKLGSKVLIKSKWIQTTYEFPNPIYEFNLDVDRSCIGMYLIHLSLFHTYRTVLQSSAWIDLRRM